VTNDWPIELRGVRLGRLLSTQRAELREILARTPVEQWRTVAAKYAERIERERPALPPWEVGRQ
jgi:hypothetical protein